MSTKGKKRLSSTIGYAKLQYEQDSKIVYLLDNLKNRSRDRL